MLAPFFKFTDLAECTYFAGAAHEYSITIQKGGADIDVARIQLLLDDWVIDNTTNAIFSTERGEKDGFLHLQGVIRTRVVNLSTPANVTKALKRLLLFTTLLQFAGHGNVCTVALKKAKLHTFDGMVGYCLKDGGKPWFTKTLWNISSQMIENGMHLYLQYGSSHSAKNFIVLSFFSLFPRAETFARLHDDNVSFRRTVLNMHKTGKYAPDAKWIIRGQGRGMDVDRAEGAWRLMREPDIAVQDDVDMIYFDIDVYDARQGLARIQSDYESDPHSSSPSSV